MTKPIDTLLQLVLFIPKPTLTSTSLFVSSYKTLIAIDLVFSYRNQNIFLSDITTSVLAITVVAEPECPHPTTSPQSWGAGVKGV